MKPFNALPFAAEVGSAVAPEMIVGTPVSEACGVRLAGLTETPSPGVPLLPLPPPQATARIDSVRRVRIVAVRRRSGLQGPGGRSQNTGAWR